MAKRPAARKHGPDQEMRDQEVLRANREMAAYFKGRRTEREARAAMKIIKTFIRDRERLPVADRQPLPGTAARKATEVARSAALGRRANARVSRPRRKGQGKTHPVKIEPPAGAGIASASPKPQPEQD